jgi:tRNA1(Val) A37 N6-methylase TrmN6
MALILAQRTSTHSRIDAIDIAKEDCEQARENIGRSPWPIESKRFIINPFRNSIQRHTI